MSAMDKMHGDMRRVEITGDLDRDFSSLMIPHHQSAVDMARVYLERGRDPELRKLAQSIIASQQAEIRLMSGRVAANDQASHRAAGH